MYVCVRVCASLRNNNKWSKDVRALKWVHLLLLVVEGAYLVRAVSRDIDFQGTGWRAYTYVRVYVRGLLIHSKRGLGWKTFHL